MNTIGDSLSCVVDRYAVRIISHKIENTGDTARLTLLDII